MEKGDEVRGNDGRCGIKKMLARRVMAGSVLGTAEETVGSELFFEFILRNI